jgi:hypothetical protein
MFDHRRRERQKQHDAEQSAAPPATDAVPAVIGGYRVVRTLGIGQRATVYLGHAIAETSEPSVALKVFGPDTDRSDIDREIHALEHSRSDHVVRLIDVAGGGLGPPTLVLERLQPVSLAGLLLTRDRIRPGEAVTLLVSICRGLHSTIDAVGGHGALSASAVMFDGTGRPVIAGFGHTTDAEPTGDRARLGQLIDAVLGHVDVDAIGRVPGVIAEVLDAPDALRRETDWHRLEAALFDLGPPEPVRLRPSAPSASSVVARRTGTDEKTSPRAERADRAGGDGVGGALWRRLVTGSTRSTVKQRLAAMIAGRRKPLIVAGSVGAAVLGVAVAVLPPGSAHSDRAHPAGTAPLSSDSGAAVHRGKRSVEESTASLGARSTDDPNDTAVAEASSSIVDDPVAAVGALLRTRDACFERGSEECLRAVDQVGTALLADDLDSVRASEVPAPLGGLRLSVIQRTGDAVLMGLTPADATTTTATQPASLLAMRSEAGWRLRELYGG